MCCRVFLLAPVPNERKKKIKCPERSTSPQINAIVAGRFIFFFYRVLFWCAREQRSDHHLWSQPQTGERKRKWERHNEQKSKKFSRISVDDIVLVHKSLLIKWENYPHDDGRCNRKSSFGWEREKNYAGEETESHVGANPEHTKLRSNKTMSAEPREREKMRKRERKKIW